MWARERGKRIIAAWLKPFQQSKSLKDVYTVQSTTVLKVTEKLILLKIQFPPKITHYHILYSAVLLFYQEIIIIKYKKNGKACSADYYPFEWYMVHIACWRFIIMLFCLRFLYHQDF